MNRGRTSAPKAGERPHTSVQALDGRHTTRRGTHALLSTGSLGGGSFAFPLLREGIALAVSQASRLASEEHGRELVHCRLRGLLLAALAQANVPATVSSGLDGVIDGLLIKDPRKRLCCAAPGCPRSLLH